MNYRQVTLYAVRTPNGEDLTEWDSVVVKTKSGDEYDGLLQNAGSQSIVLTAVGPHSDEEVTISYDDIVSMRSVW